VEHAVKAADVLKVIFEQVDSDKDGVVTRQEILSMYHKMREIDAEHESRNEMDQVCSIRFTLNECVSLSTPGRYRW
jgi:hypothetical protein